MPKRKTDTSSDDMAMLMTCKTLDEAEFVKAQLQDNEIHVQIVKNKPDPDDDDAKEGRWVMFIPEDQIDEAEAILDQRASSNEWIIDDDEQVPGPEDSGVYDHYDDYDEDQFEDLDFDESDLEEELY